MAYGDFKDKPRRKVSDKALSDKLFKTAKSPKYNGYQWELASLVYKYFDEKIAGADTSGGAIRNKILSNQELAKKLHKPIIRKFEKSIIIF